MKASLTDLKHTSYSLYRIISFILVSRFYSATMSGVVRADSGLSASLAELSQLARTQFLAMLQSSVCDWSALSMLCSHWSISDQFPPGAAGGRGGPGPGSCHLGNIQAE